MVWEAEKEMAWDEERRRHPMSTRGGGHRGNVFILLQYIDDVNSVRIGKEKPMDEALGKQVGTTVNSGIGRKTGRIRYTWG